MSDCDSVRTRRISDCFNRLFAQTHSTILVSGAQEPFYQPAREAGDLHRIFSRYDYPASALHEIAHWCIAGEHRRGLPDYGYWYAEDGRNAQQQREFQCVEVRPQALEWRLSMAAGMTFQVSIDNLHGEPLDVAPFKVAVWQQASEYFLYGLPERAAWFCDALEKEFLTFPRAPQLAELLGA